MGRRMEKFLALLGLLCPTKKIQLLKKIIIWRLTFQKKGFAASSPDLSGRR